jgi:hypothetical protein
MERSEENLSTAWLLVANSEADGKGSTFCDHGDLGGKRTTGKMN